MKTIALLKRSYAEPFPAFFALGWLMGFLFLGIWPAFGLFHLVSYPGALHAQGIISLFVGSFAIGFLLTSLPRFTGSYSASILDVGILFLLSFTEIYFLVSGNGPFASLTMSFKFLYVFYFGFSRARNKTLVPPPSFIWIIFALTSVVLGGVGIFEGTFVTLFKAFVFRGFVTSLFLGVGGRLMPFLTGMPFINTQNEKTSNHFLAAVIYFSGFFFGKWGYFLQALALIFEVAYLWGLYHKPGSGTRAKVLWVSSWLLVLGPVLSFIWPQHALHLMHLTYIGCFAAGTLTVASHVIVSHMGLDKKILTQFWPLGVVWSLVILAALTRATAHMANYLSHLSYAAILVMGALLLWLRCFIR